ncbi:hypothetical protein [Allosphingosinicella indica]|uniref:XRE family transcriptional regulator n=1 Tax=Allosphingosinicella indica TaxID=941907 RepID=A0A1X7GJI5_9SPHN|nr:hypothetical protein [Allosphingosinicella indica]SMF70650.1 hypothetical protein SAMN06295910_1923 [Allosphingosinicella indica]
MDIPSDDELLAKIEAFLDRHAMPPTRFGRDATGEPQLIKSIREGRSPSLKVLQRLAAFMAEKDAELAAADHDERDSAAVADAAATIAAENITLTPALSRARERGEVAA